MTPAEPCPPVPGPSSGADEPLADLFWAVARRLRHLSRTALEPWGLAPSQARAVATLLAHGGLTPGALAERLHIAPRSATEILDQLAALDLVERRPHPDDRRSTLVGLTAHGRQVAEAVRRARAVEAETFFAVLDAPERAELVRLLGRLSAR